MNPIAKMLIDMAKYYDQQLEERQLEMYVDVLSQFPINDVIQAGREYLRDHRNTRFPMPPHKIMAKHLPSEPESKDVGREVALRIREAVSKFGWPNPNPARDHIGHLGWGVVEAMGGWQQLCEKLGVEIQESTFLAQCRDAVESRHRLGSTFTPEQLRRLGEQSRESRGELQKFSLGVLLPPKKESE